MELPVPERDTIELPCVDGESVPDTVEVVLRDGVVLTQGKGVKDPVAQEEGVGVNRYGVAEKVTVVLSVKDGDGEAVWLTLPDAVKEVLGEAVIEELLELLSVALGDLLAEPELTPDHDMVK